MKRFVGILLWILVLAFVFIMGFVNYLTMYDYKPAKVLTLIEKQNTPELAFSDMDTINVLTWNIGYAGLDDSMDFFYDGGERVRTRLDKTKDNLYHICNVLEKQDSVDFIYLQEVDVCSKRSWYMNQPDSIQQHLALYNGVMAVNYFVKYLPVPLTSPLGKVHSGIMIFGKKEPDLSERYAYKGNFSWPKRMLMPDRCYMANYYPLDNGKNLVLVNLHNSAFDDGSMRTEQLKQLRDYCVTQYDSGNYVIVGGDWNMCPPDMKPDRFSKLPDDAFHLFPVDKKIFSSDWSFAYDPNTPTNRYLNEPFNPNTTARVTLDFFLLSPNVDIITVKAVNHDFKYSDHNPVFMQIRLES